MRGTKHFVSPYAGSQKEGGRYLVMGVLVRVLWPLRGEAVVRSSGEGCVIGYTRQSSIGRREAFFAASLVVSPAVFARSAHLPMWRPMGNSGRPCSPVLIQRFVHNRRRPRHANSFPTAESYLPVWRDCQTSQSGREIRSAHMTAPPAVAGQQ